MNNKEGLKVEFTNNEDNKYRIKAVWHNEKANRFTGSVLYPYEIGVSLIKETGEQGEQKLKSGSGFLSYNKEVVEEFTFKKGLYDKKYKLWFVVNNDNDNRQSKVIKIVGEQEKPEVIEISSESESETESAKKKGKRKIRNDSETESAKKKGKRKIRNDSETESATKKGKRKIRNDSETESAVKQLKGILDDSKKQKQNLASFQVFFNNFIVPRVNWRVTELENGVNKAIEASEKALRDFNANKC
jgi:hypothetical protein